MHTTERSSGLVTLRRTLVGVGLAVASTCAVASTAGAAPVTPGAPDAPATVGWVRLGHFAPGGGKVDLVVDGRVASTAIGSGDVTPYVRVPAGTHRVQAIPTGMATASPVVDVETGVPGDGSVTVGVVSTLDGVGAQVYDDSPSRAPAGSALVRFIHTVPDFPAVDIAVAGGPVLASDVAYPDATPYGVVAPGTYDVEVRRSGTSEVLLRVAAWKVAAGSEATVIVNRTDAGALSVVPVLDAGGTAAMPSGGAATGFGGMAPAPGPSQLLWGTVVAGVALAVIGAGRRRSRSAAPALALIAAMGLGACGASARGGSAGGNAMQRHTTSVPTTSVPTASVATTAVTPVEPVDAPVEPATAVPIVPGANVNVADVGEPIAVSIPSLGVSSTLVPLGLAPDGTVEVPATADQAGWYTGGPKPGDIGTSVILGHVDSHDGPGVFFRLRELAPGAEVVVASADGDHRFVVDHSEQVAKEAFPSDAVYGSSPEPALRLVTCGGAFDRAAGHYVDNVVVYLHAAPED